MTENEIYNSNLTNRFTGMKNTNIKQALTDRFQFSVENTSRDAARVALVPAYFDTTKVNFFGKPGDPDSKIVYEKNNPEQLIAAGFNVDAVLSDDSSSFGDGKITCKAGNPSRTIENFLTFIKTNPTALKRITIMAENAKGFDTDMQVTVVNPFNQNKVETVDVSSFFDKYQFQPDRIDIDFKDNELELSDVTLLLMTIPADTKLNFIFRF